MDVAFVCEMDDDSIRAHPTHLDWASEVGADIIPVKCHSLPGELSKTFLKDISKLNSPIPDTYRTYVFEGIGCLYSLVASNVSGNVILLDSTWRLQGSEAHFFSQSPVRSIMRAERDLDAFLLKWLIRKYVDGIVTASEMIRKRDISYFPDIPVEVVNPPVKARDELQSWEGRPNIRDNTYLYYGANRSHKCLSLLLQAWHQSFGELIVAGKGTEGLTISDSSVTVAGFVDSPVDVFSKACALVHPARSDAYPISTLEAMLCNLPVIISDRAGTSPLVKDVNEALVFDPCHWSNISESLRYYGSISAEGRLAISQQLQNKANDAAEGDDFTDGLSALLNKIQ